MGHVRGMGRINEVKFRSFRGQIRVKYGFVMCVRVCVCTIMSGYCMCRMMCVCVWVVYGSCMCLWPVTLRDPHQNNSSSTIYTSLSITLISNRVRAEIRPATRSQYRSKACGLGLLLALNIGQKRVG